MDYFVETASASSQRSMLEFLKERENYTLFLLENFKLIRSLEKIVGVFCLTKSGNLLIEASVKEPIFETVFKSLPCRINPYYRSYWRLGILQRFLGVFKKTKDQLLEQFLEKTEKKSLGFFSKQ